VQSRAPAQKGKGYRGVSRLGSFELGRVESRHVEGGDASASDGWPQEVRKLLFEAHQDASALRSERQALLARASDLESRLEAAHGQVADLTGQVARLQAEARARRPARAPAATPPAPARPAPSSPEQRWLSDVTDRTASALRSGQEAAQTLVERARQRAKAIEQAAAQESAALRERADAQASKVLRLANYDAEGVLQGAQAAAEELLAEARKAAQEVMGELHRRRDRITREIEAMEARRMSLLQACAAIRRPVDEAIRTLERAGADPRPPARSPKDAISAALTTARRVSGRAPGG